MATTQLSLYNGALRLLGQTNLEDTDEAREPRYFLDDAWNDGFRNYVLEQGLWNFAMRTAKLSVDSSVDPSFGFQNGFSKPSDWVRTALLSSDEYFRSALTELDIADEQAYWFSDLTTLYVKYVSNASSYGTDLTLWPQSFVKYAEAYLALQILPRIHQSTAKLEDVQKTVRRLLDDARAKDAMNEGAGFRPEGSWTRARRGGASRRDRGSRGALTG